MTGRLRMLVPGGMLLLSLASAAGAQDPLPTAAGAPVPAEVVEPGPPLASWTAEAIASRDSYVSDRTIWRPWTAVEVLVARRFARGSIGVGLAQVERFGRRDGAWSVDAYRALWTGAYANVRGQVSREGMVLPETDVSAELYQGLGSGWEPSVGLRRLGYADPVFLTSLALGKYVGDRWHGRIRGTVAERSGGGGGTSGSGLLRRYLGSSREFVELAVGGGEEAVTAGISQTGALVVDVREMGFLEVGGRKYLTRQFGAMLAGSFHSFEAMPDRLGARVGIIARF